MLQKWDVSIAAFNMTDNGDPSVDFFAIPDLWKPAPTWPRHHDSIARNENPLFSLNVAGESNLKTPAKPHPVDGSSRTQHWADSRS